MTQVIVTKLFTGHKNPKREISKLVLRYEKEQNSKCNNISYFVYEWIDSKVELLENVFYDTYNRDKTYILEFTFN
jgi:hypothetical protein